LDAGGGKHSVFAKAFLDVLDSNNDVLEGWYLYNLVSKIVTYSLAQLFANQSQTPLQLHFLLHAKTHNNAFTAR